MANESKFVRNADGSVSFEINDETILSAKGKQAGISEVTADDIDSGTSTQGQVLTSDGDGTASWMNNVIPNSTTDSTQYSLLVGNNGDYFERKYTINTTETPTTTRLFGNVANNVFTGLSYTRLSSSSQDTALVISGSPRWIGSQNFPSRIQLQTVDYVPKITLFHAQSNFPKDKQYGVISLRNNSSYNTEGPYEGVVIQTSSSSLVNDSPRGGYTYYFSRYRKGTEPTNDTTNLIVAVEPTSETFTIASSDWLADATISPFTYKTTMTATTTIANDTLVELVNDNAVNFATYGFSIGDVTGQVITIYSIGQPSASVTFTVRIGN